MANRVVLLLNRGSFEPAYQAASIAVTAAAMGEEVFVVLAFEALLAWGQDSFGRPSSDGERAAWERGSAMGVLEPSVMLEEARSLGARLIACDTMVKLCGLEEPAMKRKLDEVLGLASIWRLTQGARTVSL